MSARERRMTDETTQPGRLGRLLARLRRAEPKQPRWWHFAPHAVLAISYWLVTFFFQSLRNSGFRAICDIDFILLFFIMWPGIHISLPRSLWLWLRSGSWQGAIWLLRPTLLLCAFLGGTPISQAGKRWEFEKQLSERNQVVQIILAATSMPPVQGRRVEIELPQGYQHLSRRGRVSLEGKEGTTLLVFHRPAAEYIYYVGSPLRRTVRQDWYDDHWSLESAGSK